MSAFSQRHYVAIAQALRMSRPVVPAPADRDAQWLSDRRKLVEMFEQDSSRFNRAKFIKATEEK